MIELKSDKLYFSGGVAIDNPHRVSIPGGLTVIGGPNGAGKTTLARILAGGWNFRTNAISSPLGKPRIDLLEFSDIHSLAGFSTAYYQQRYESSMNDDVPTVREIIGESIDSDQWARLTDLLSLRDIADKRVNFLSSGELRKLLIINKLLRHPDILILDNPYIGLDRESRASLDHALSRLTTEGANVIMLICDPDDLPEAAAALIPMNDGAILPPVAGSADTLRAELARLMDYRIDPSAIPAAPRRQNPEAAIVMEMKGCDVRYGSRTIVSGVDWVIHKGERWALSGPNGSGKSTLLSIIHADNPQRYSNRITLFGMSSGGGESIWDIKRRIGYISPEMHLYFNGGGNVETIVAQGLNDTVGLYVKVEPWQAETARRWLRLLHIDHLAQRRFNTLSSGEQRLVLLARTLIKQPELLILDEPLHGLDKARKSAIKSLLDTMLSRPDTPMSLIYVTHYPAELPLCITHSKTLSTTPTK